MSARLDPLVASDAITSTYHRYVKTLVDVREPALSAAFGDVVDRGRVLHKGPLLEATPAYQTGASLRQLVDEGVLNQDFISLDSVALPLDRPLYLHQEQAIRKAVDGRNLVVTTGTGSGKTESFLIPILNHLIGQASAGPLGPGVRALLLYPMNALANDQMKRLRALLANRPDVTFGRYTGEAKETAAEARNQFKALYPDDRPLPNELLSRQEMRAAPPHILLTNYAMLEYMLLRPIDMDLFAADAWQFIALDEAHVYDGAKGAEIAMLLRRLRDRVAPDKSLQCIATSASLTGRPATVMRFASNLFGVPFEWNDDDAARRDLVAATRVTSPERATWALTPEAIADIDGADDRRAAILQMAAHQGREFRDAAEALDQEESLVELRKILALRPTAVSQVAAKLWPDSPDSRQTLDRLVDIASGLHDEAGNPVLSARYHLFVRSTEGAFTCLSESGPHVQLSRHTECPTCSAACFEFGACQRCGAVYLAGTVQDGRFTPATKAGGALQWLMLGDADEIRDEDDETLAADAQPDAANRAFLCAHCGTLHESAAERCTSCGAGNLRPVLRYEKRRAVMQVCAKCGAMARDVVRRLNTGSDAPPAVLTTALYQQLPPSDDAHARELTGEGRKLLMFSDSRQAAAFAAPYLEDTYGRLQERRLIVHGLARAAVGGKPVSYQDVLFHTMAAAAESGFFADSQSHGERVRTVALWIMSELVTLEVRQSLEGLGLMAVRHDPPALPLPAPLKALGLSDVEAWAFLEELLRTVRQQGGLSMPADVAADDPRFAPRTGPIFVRNEASDAKRKVISWKPTRGTNRRIDYIQRVLDDLDSTESALTILDGCWKFLERIGWLSKTLHRTAGAVWQDDHHKVRLVEGANTTWYQCSQCRRFASQSVRGICPGLACTGKLEPVAIPAAEFDDQHYRRLYRTLTPVPMTAMEHTAQWTSAKAASIQQDFIAGRVNALSCSTTFELGVDVGDLQSVVLRNMPPTTANYVQRAGRAGRRAQSAALVLTYAQRRSHDLSRFARPEEMISGEMRVPFVPLENERIARRHAHSVAMAAFFRHEYDADGSTWSKAGQFFVPEEGSTSAPVDRVKDFLSPIPAGITQSLRRALPSAVHHDVGVDSGEWTMRLVDLLAQVRADINNEVGNFRSQQTDAASSKRFNLAHSLEKTINTVLGRDLLGYLASRNVLPKYGFPVDTVELRTSHAGAQGGELSLDRDLTQAIYDYAPANQIVAGGRRWTSGGVYLMPGKELLTHSYRTCTHCGRYAQDAPANEPACPSCDEPWANQARTYIVPEFGFVALRESEAVGTTPPDRAWHGGTHVLSVGAEIATRQWTSASGSAVRARAGARGKLVAISEGATGGFDICHWCGWGAPSTPKPPKKHTRPRDGKPCDGHTRRQTLGHAYETDIVELRFPELQGIGMSQSDWLSFLFAVVEGASERLEISRNDLGGALYRTEDNALALVLFDTVPGGAGGARLIADNIDKVIRGALDRVERCECGEETSCYACLRSFQNGRYHDELTRRGALLMLDHLRPGPAASATAIANGPALDEDWARLYSTSLSDHERRVIAGLAVRGVPLPEQGYEAEDGTPLALAWPETQVAASDAGALVSPDWTIIDLTDPNAVEQVQDALHATHARQRQ